MCSRKECRRQSAPAPPLTGGKLRSPQSIRSPLQDSCLGNPMDRGAWQAMVHGVLKSRAQLSPPHTHTWGFPSGPVVGTLPAMQETRGTWVDPWVRKIPWRRVWQPTPVFLLGESHGQRSLATIHGDNRSVRAERTHGLSKVFPGPRLHWRSLKGPTAPTPTVPEDWEDVPGTALGPPC